MAAFLFISYFVYYREMKPALNVPYYSQFLDVANPFWMVRACGATSLKMVAEYQGKEVPGIIALCDEAKERGGYDMSNGWMHDYLVLRAGELGLKAYRLEGLSDMTEIAASLKESNPVIVSVEKRILEQTKFHMIVIVGCEDGKVMYHEPESTDRERGAYRICDEGTFMSYWRGKAIFISQ